jgi:hypothetical protein
MEDAGGLVASRADALSGAPHLEAYERGEVASLLAEAADRQAALQAAIDEARQAALQPPRPLDVVPRADAERALQAAEARLQALEAELAAARSQLQGALLGQATLAPLVPPVAPPTTAPVHAPAPAPAEPSAPAWVEPTVAVPPIVAAPVAEPAAEVPTAAPPQVAAPQVIVQRVPEPFARTTGLLQVITWSIVVAVVLIVLLAWFA